MQKKGAVDGTKDRHRSAMCSATERSEALSAEQTSRGGNVLHPSRPKSRLTAVGLETRLRAQPHCHSLGEKPTVFSPAVEATPLFPLRGTKTKGISKRRKRARDPEKYIFLIHKTAPLWYDKL